MNLWIDRYLRGNTPCPLREPLKQPRDGRGTHLGKNANFI